MSFVDHQYILKKSDLSSRFVLELEMGVIEKLSPGKFKQEQVHQKSNVK
jgi:hypothetical protein